MQNECNFALETLNRRRAYLQAIEKGLKAAAEQCPDDEDWDIMDAIEQAQSLNWGRLEDVQNEIDMLVASNY